MLVRRRIQTPSDAKVLSVVQPEGEVVLGASPPGPPRGAGPGGPRPPPRGAPPPGWGPPPPGAGGPPGPPVGGGPVGPNPAARLSRPAF